MNRTHNARTANDWLVNHDTLAPLSAPDPKVSALAHVPYGGGGTLRLSLGRGVGVAHYLFTRRPRA
jgi:hypothetical protein